MFTIGNVNENGVLSMQMHGRLTMEEYRQAMPQFEALLKKHGRLRFYVDMTDFSGSDLGAIWEGGKFDLTHLRQYDRSAIVGDKKWEEWAIRFSGWLLNAPVRFFYKQDAHKAWEWVNGNDGG